MLVGPTPAASCQRNQWALRKTSEDSCCCCQMCDCCGGNNRVENSCVNCAPNTSNPTRGKCSVNAGCDGIFAKCPTPHWCTAIADHYLRIPGQPARPCPFNSTSAPGSTKRTDCTCVFGHFDAAAVSNQIGFGPLCKPCRALASCPQNTYLAGACTKTSDYACEPCPANSGTNASGATSIAQCRCLSGYHDIQSAVRTAADTGARRAMFSSSTGLAAAAPSVPAAVGWSWRASWVNASSSDSSRAGVGTPSSLCSRTDKPRNCLFNAMDGNTSTAWGCNTRGGPCWLQLNLGAPRRIGGLALLTAQGGLVSATLQYRTAEKKTPWKDALRVQLPAVSPDTITEWRSWPATAQFWKLNQIFPASATEWPAVREAMLLVVEGMSPRTPPFRTASKFQPAAACIACELLTVESDGGRLTPIDALQTTHSRPPRPPYAVRALPVAPASSRAVLVRKTRTSSARSVAIPRAPLHLRLRMLDISLTSLYHCQIRECV